MRNLVLGEQNRALRKGVKSPLRHVLALRQELNFLTSSTNKEQKHLQAALVSPLGSVFQTETVPKWPQRRQRRSQAGPKAAYTTSPEALPGCQDFKTPPSRDTERAFLFLTSVGQKQLGQQL